MSTAFISRLKAKNPEAQISVLCAPYLSPIFENHSAVDEVIKLPYQNGGSVFEVANIIKGKSFDEIFILPKSFRTALEAWLSKIPRRVGFSGDMQKFLLTEAHPRFDRKGFDPYRYLRLLGEKDLGAEEIYTFFPKEEPDRDAALTLMGRPVKSLPRPILGIAPKSVAQARTWELKRFAEVARRFLDETGGTVFLFGIESERPATSLVKSRAGKGAVDFTGLLNLPERAGLLGWALDLCDYFLCNDSGLMHVAIALGVPTLTVYGSGDPNYASYKKKGPFLSIQHREIFCVPCLRNNCVRFGSSYNECLKAVSVDEVLTGLKRLGKKAQIK